MAMILFSRHAETQEICEKLSPSGNDLAQFYFPVFSYTFLKEYPALNYLESPKCLLLLFVSQGLCLLSWEGLPSDTSFHLVFPNFYLVWIFSSFRIEVKCHILIKASFEYLWESWTPQTGACILCYTDIYQRLYVLSYRLLIYWWGTNYRGNLFAG